MFLFNIQVIRHNFLYEFKLKDEKDIYPYVMYYMYADDDKVEAKDVEREERQGKRIGAIVIFQCDSSGLPRDEDTVLFVLRQIQKLPSNMKTLLGAKTANGERRTAMGSEQQQKAKNKIQQQQQQQLKFFTTLCLKNII